MTTYYTATGAPAAATKGLSASIRAEFELIESAFAALSPAGGTAVSIPYIFSTTTTVADPGTGTLRLNQAAQNTATAVLADLSDANTTDVTDVLALFDESTSAVKGFLRIVKLGDATDWLLFSVSAMTSPSGYRDITVSNVASSAASPFADGDSILLEFSRTGDKGSSSDTVLYSARTANTVLGPADKGKFIDVTSGTFSQTFSAAATLGSGWWVYLRNSGTGKITLDPDASEQIDGLTTFVMYPGEARFVQCDGSALRSVVLKPFLYQPTATETWTKPPGYLAFDVYVQAPGGGGGSGRRGSAGSNRYGGGGGSGGSIAQAVLRAAVVAATETVTIGAPGTGGAAVTADDTNGNNGTAGGYSSFGSLLVALGGAFGSGGSSYGSAAGAAIAATGGNITKASTAGGGGSAVAGLAGSASATDWSATGGGGGGGIDTGDSIANGAAGGAQGPSANLLAGGAAGTTGAGQDGAVGNSVALRRAGTGGGGGASNKTAAAGAGGAGAAGGGGGGGGASLNSYNSGAGGAGGAGYFEIVGVA